MAAGQLSDFSGFLSPAESAPIFDEAQRVSAFQQHALRQLARRFRPARTITVPAIEPQGNVLSPPAKAAFLKRVAALWPVARGTVSLVRKPCGRSRCRACASGRGHPALIFTCRVDGRGRCLHVRVRDEAEISINGKARIAQRVI